MSLVNSQNGVVFGNRSIWEKHYVNHTTKFVTDSTSWDSFSFTGFTVVYSQSANLAPVPALSSSSNDASLSSTLASSPREDIFTYIRRLIPSPSPEATPARITRDIKIVIRNHDSFLIYTLSRKSKDSENFVSWIAGLCAPMECEQDKEFESYFSMWLKR
jgi:hypothetical protein